MNNYYAHRLMVLRVARAFLLAAAVPNIIVGTAHALSGQPGALYSFAVVLFMAAVAALETYLIRGLRALNRPRPDYAAITRMEREVWGNSLSSDPAPVRRNPAGTGVRCAFCDRPWIAGSAGVAQDSEGDWLCTSKEECTAWLRSHYGGATRTTPGAS